IDARGVDYRAPVKLAVDEVRIVKPWALIDRNEQGQLSLRAALAAKPRSTPTPESAPAQKDPALKPEVVIHHALFEDGGTNVVDDSVEPAARFARAAGIDVQWPGAVRVTSVEIEKPWVLFEREASGRFPLVDLLTPRVRAKTATPAAREAGRRETTEPLRVSLGRLALSDG